MTQFKNSFPIPEPQSPTPNAFPTVRWGDATATFFTDAANRPLDAPVTAVLVFAMEGDCFVLADIAGRGLCIPGGRLEPGETPLEALHREVYEEIGGKISETQSLGYYLVTADDGKRTTIPVFVAEVTERGAIPEGSESRGVVTLSRKQMPTHYFTWDALMEAVFDEAVRFMKHQEEKIILQ